MRKYIYLLGVLFGLLACADNSNKMTDSELKLITEADAFVPFKVLLTSDKEDSLFLRQKSKDIPEVEMIVSSPEFKLFVNRLKMTLAEEMGVGLAAPQVGIGRNVFLFMRMDQPERKVEVAINPRIVEHSKETFTFEGDGCLSIPGLSGNTTRYQWVDVEYYDELGTLKKERLSGTSRQGDFTGVIFQHEFDHLEGVLFIDRLAK